MTCFDLKVTQIIIQVWIGIGIGSRVGLGVITGEHLRRGMVEDTAVGGEMMDSTAAGIKEYA